jgi:type IV secretory pathway VirB2 component (pilin)
MCMKNILNVRYNMGTLLVVLGATILILMPESALAATPFTNNSIADVLCRIVNTVTGNFGRGVATLAVIFYFIAAFEGKMNPWQGVAVMIGISLIFRADQVVEIITKEKFSCKLTVQKASVAFNPECSAPLANCTPQQLFISTK